MRNFSPTPIDEKTISYLIETARLAPSAVNYQPWYFIVVREEEQRIQLQRCYPREWFAAAPLFIVVCGDHSQSWKRKDGKDFCDIDAAIAIEHICLAATESGLGTCWVCNFDASICSEVLGLPDCIEPVAILPVGYPISEAFPSKNRKNTAEIVKWEKF
jgi:nitroreductase